MAVALGLIAALLWGATDFLIRLGGRSLGVHRSSLYAQAFSLSLIGVWTASDPASRHALGDASASAWIAAAIAAVIGLAATLALYRGLQIGRVSVVSPVAGAYGAVTAVLALLSGESIGIAALAGIALIVGAVVLIAKPEAVAASATAATTEPRTSGFLWAAISCLGYGVCYWIQGRFAVPQLGPLLPVGVFYVVSTSALVAAAVVRRPSLRMSWRDAGLVMSTGSAGVLGYIALSAGLTTGSVAVVTVISSLQSPVTVGLAVLFLGERLVRRQWVAVAAIVVGLGLVRA